MGFLKNLFIKLGWSKEPCHIVVLGLDNAGKSTIIQRLKAKKTAVQDVVPTVGFQVEKFTQGNVNFTVYDMSGQGRYRDLWQNYYHDVQAIIFVIDSEDEIRMKTAQHEISNMLEYPDVKNNRNIPCLFFANKMDRPGAKEPSEITRALELQTLLHDRTWNITPSNALTGENLETGIEWLTSKLMLHKK
eukprot:Rmarinus@m.27327